MSAKNAVIELRGGRVRNLRNLDLEIPLGRLVAITGVSGAGKSSLAFETLFAEGRRRYVETLSTAARGLLDPIERPEVDFIGQIPPAIAVRQRFAETSWRPTVATAAELHPLFRSLFARAGRLHCTGCQREIQGFSPPQAAALIAQKVPATRVQIGFEIASRSDRARLSDPDLMDRLNRCLQAGFVRTIVGEQTLAANDLMESVRAGNAPAGAITIVVDRLTAGSPLPRLTESLEQACRYGHGVSITFSQSTGIEAAGRTGQIHLSDRTSAITNADVRTIDGQAWHVETWSEMLRCVPCGTTFTDPDPLLFSYNQPRAACPKCKGLGVVREKRGEHVPCAACGGGRLKPESLAWQFEGQSIADLLKSPADRLLADWSERLMGGAGNDHGLRQTHLAIEARLRLLVELGLGYVELDRPLRTLSAGEAQRVRLAGALATDLVHMLYVLDEPTAGLHPRDICSLMTSLRNLRDAGNSVVLIEHNVEVVAECDHVIDLGPGAGRDGGTVVFQGAPTNLRNAPASVTGMFLKRLTEPTESQPGKPVREPLGWLEFSGLTSRNLDNLSVRIPLGVLCVVTGVSGSGKSTLVNDCVAGLVEQTLRPGTTGGFSKGTVVGAERLRDVQRIEQAPLGRSRRNIPASYLGLLGPIRQLFASGGEAQARNFGPGHFSSHAGSPGCCETCGGLGVIEVDMQFLPDLETPCPDCHGLRYRKEILEIKYRGMSIAELLAQSAKELLPILRGQTRIQRKLKLLLDVGLDALTLGQPAHGLSAGETQRLRLAECLSRIRGGNCLIVLDEPTRGLHPADVSRLLRGFDHILSAGHSLLVVEHQRDVIAAADWVIEMGPGGGSNGGQVMAVGGNQMTSDK
ncbi:MAG: hypothetical protein NT069_17745 [Planctomycetota bacterium]|nr:hypothetical protein [Planctomycetota bacterium]